MKEKRLCPLTKSWIRHWSYRPTSSVRLWFDRDIKKRVQRSRTCTRKLHAFRSFLYKILDCVSSAWMFWLTDWLIDWLIGCTDKMPPDKMPPGKLTADKMPLASAIVSTYTFPNTFAQTRFLFFSWVFFYYRENLRIAKYCVINKFC